jgi:hypothetical protein
MVRENLPNSLGGFDGSRKANQVVGISFSESKLLYQALSIVAAFEQLDYTITEVGVVDKY